MDGIDDDEDKAKEEEEEEEEEEDWRVDRLVKDLAFEGESISMLRMVLQTKMMSDFSTTIFDDEVRDMPSTS